MATTVIKVQAAVGQTEVTLTANGGSGTASNPYTLTRIAGTLCSISVPQALTGNWHCVDGVGLETLIYDLVDEAVTIELGNVPSVTQIREEMDNNSTQLAVAAAGAVGSVEVEEDGDDLTLSFKGADGTTEVANVTYTPATGARTRNS